MYLGGLAKVSLHSKCTPSHLADVLGKRVSSLFLAGIANCDISPNLCQAQGRRIANAATGSCNQRDTSMKVHQLLLSRKSSTLIIIERASAMQPEAIIVVVGSSLLPAENYYGYDCQAAG